MSPVPGAASVFAPHHREIWPRAAGLLWQTEGPAAGKSPWQLKSGVAVFLCLPDLCFFMFVLGEVRGDMGLPLQGTCK